VGGDRLPGDGVSGVFDVVSRDDELGAWTAVLEDVGLDPMRGERAERR
jgi:hypothetical protein